MKARILLELARGVTAAIATLKRLENKLLAASWNAQRKDGRGPWELV